MISSIVPEHRWHRIGLSWILRRPLERVEIVAHPPLGRRTGEDRNVTASVIIEILDTPLARAEAILVDRHFPMEGIDRRIDEAIPALKVELKCSPCFVFTCTIRNASYRAADVGSSTRQA